MEVIKSILNKSRTLILNNINKAEKLLTNRGKTHQFQYLIIKLVFYNTCTISAVFDAYMKSGAKTLLIFTVAEVKV